MNWLSRQGESLKNKLNDGAEECADAELIDSCRLGDICRIQARILGLLFEAALRKIRFSEMVADFIYLL
jgi:hypothetical protein